MGDTKAKDRSRYSRTVRMILKERNRTGEGRVGLMSKQEKGQEKEKRIEGQEKVHTPFPIRNLLSRKR